MVRFRLTFEEEPEEKAGPIKMPNEVFLKLFRAKTKVRIDKAVKLLDYQPMFDLEKGMALTNRWAKWANLL